MRHSLPRNSHCAPTGVVKKGGAPARSSPLRAPSSRRRRRDRRDRNRGRPRPRRAVGRGSARRRRRNRIKRARRAAHSVPSHRRGARRTCRTRSPDGRRRGRDRGRRRRPRRRNHVLRERTDGDGGENGGGGNEQVLLHASPPQGRCRRRIVPDHRALSYPPGDQRGKGSITRT
jgi:hypothetical protein